MNVFVTGGAGYIGSVCVEELCRAGHQVTVFDNLSEGHRSAVDHRAQFIRGELSDQDFLTQSLRATRADAVMHFAAFALVGESMTDPGKYFGSQCSWRRLYVSSPLSHAIYFWRRHLDYFI